MKKVLIIMGSDSDLNIMSKATEKLEQFGIDYELRVCSAHRSPDKAAKLAKEASENGFGVIIAGAGLAAHLPGVLAAFTVLPVIAVPISAGALKGVDALLAEVQMPSGIPVATVAIDGAANAGILATQILAVNDEQLTAKLIEFKLSLAEAVERKDEAIRNRCK